MIKVCVWGKAPALLTIIMCCVHLLLWLSPLLGSVPDPGAVYHQHSLWCHIQLGDKWPLRSGYIITQELRKSRAKALMYCIASLSNHKWWRLLSKGELVMSFSDSHAESVRSGWKEIFSSALMSVSFWLQLPNTLYIWKVLKQCKGTLHCSLVHDAPPGFSWVTS